MHIAALLITSISSLAGASQPNAGEGLELATRGHANYTIVVAGDAAKNADDPERHAADELAKFLHEISGAEFAVKSADKAGSGAKFLIGADAASSVIRADELPELGRDGFIIRTHGKDIAIAGGRPRGTLYGVYSFLEERLGCRWFTPDVSRIPKDPSPRVQIASMRFVPPLEYRATDYPNSRDADWAARNKLDGTQTLIDAKRGGKIDYDHFVHTFNAIVEPAKYFSSHPEYFSEIGGKRTADNAQLCVTNPDVLKLAIDTVRGWMKASPTASIYSVSQNDCFNPCQCANCKALYEEAGGAWSGPYLAFVNSIAEALAKEFPDKAIDTLAYQFTRKPPVGIQPLANVIVRLCSIECCFAHTLDVAKSIDPANAAFADDIKAWSKLCKRLYIWDYVIDYSHALLPFPNLKTIAPNIRFFVANGVKGIYEESDYFTKGGEFAELRTWIIAKSLWNPEYETQLAIAEFLDGFYEDAHAPIAEYINLLNERAAAFKAHFTIWADPFAPMFNSDFLERADKLFDAAEASVKSKAAVLVRVKTARLPIEYVHIAQLSNAIAKGGAAADKSELKSRLEHFDASAKQAGLTMINEGESYDAWLASERKLCE